MQKSQNAIYDSLSTRYAMGAVDVGNRVLSFFVLILVILMFSYGGYNIWYQYVSEHDLFTSSNLKQYSPQGNKFGLNELVAINSDVRAWITIDDTHIDYPVVQGEVDETYLNRNVFKEFSLAGSIFLSYANSPDFSDNYNLLYGHHVEGGAMFGDVTKFQEQAYFDSHRTGTLLMPDHSTREIELFCAVLVDSYDDRIYQPGNIDVASFNEYLKEKAVQYRDIQILKDDDIIGLSTCLDTVTNGRVVLYGRLK